MTDMSSGQERSNLNKMIWGIANDLRGSIDGWYFKQYVLGILFYRFISENLSSYVNEYINNEQKKAGEPVFRYADLDDEDAKFAEEFTLKEKGFFIYPSELFENVLKVAKEEKKKEEEAEKKKEEEKEKNKKEGKEEKETEEEKEAEEENEAEEEIGLSKTLKEAFKRIELSSHGKASEKNMKGLFNDFDVRSNRLGSTVKKRNAKLLQLLIKISELKQNGDYNNNSIDFFGETYEYLMTMYAANAGKSGGEFFTPQEVSELLALIATVGKKEVNKVYDPACGSGSLLLKFAKVWGKDKNRVRNGFFGQEINLTNYNLCRINMFLHNINYKKFNIALGDTLTDPKHWDDEPFEAIVSNPPYSIRWEGEDNKKLLDDPRFASAPILAPKSKADLAFVMHCLSWLAENGTAAIVSFPGAMYRGGAEQKIRKYMVDKNYVDAVIQLPVNLFFGTSIATCILVLRKNKSDNKILFIDATNQFSKDNAKNKLDKKHIKEILNFYKNRKMQKHFSYIATHKEIQKNNYNISVGAYVEAKDNREVINIKKTNAEIKKSIARQNKLRKQIDAIIAEIES